MKKITLFTLLTLLFCTSCVTKKKFMLAEMAATVSKDSLQGLLTDCRHTNAQMSAQIKNLLRDTTKMGNSIRQYQSMLNMNMTEQEKLNALLNQKKNELNERERTINELQQMINAQNEKVQNLLSSVKDALLGFSSDELTVREKDGKVYVAMSDKLLFQSGSARLDKRGEEALGKLAEVLNKQTDIDVFIEGHTDNKPINTVQFKDNWDLSVIRATSVVRILIKNYGVNPLQIQPSGRGEYMPVDDNETAEGRSKRNAEANELLEFDNGIKAIVMNLEEDNVGAVLLGPTDRIKEGFIVKRTKRIASIRVGEGMLGRVIDPLGEPLDGKGLVGGDLYDMPLERKAPGVIFRQPVNQPLQTGLKAVDAMIPIGRGQRELIIGDRQTGKTSIYKVCLSS